jgi:hypothetical protein
VPWQKFIARGNWKSEENKADEEKILKLIEFLLILIFRDLLNFQN